MEKILSANTANQLFWLGRYAERGYQMLHLLRKAYDEIIDVPDGVMPYSEFLEKIGVYISSDISSCAQMMAQIYDINTVNSLHYIIERMMDNAIVLRPEIYSESFSYIEMCRNLIREKSNDNEPNISELQPITDYLLAFWGSIRERVSGRTYSLLELGRLIEHLDMNIRFDYQHYRIDEVWSRVKAYMPSEQDLFDRVQAGRFEMYAGSEEEYDNNLKKNKYEMIAALNGIVKI